MKKHLTNVRRQDLYLRYEYENHDGQDVYSIHMLADYRNGVPPLGHAYIKAGTPLTDIKWAGHIKRGSRLMSVNMPDEGVRDD